MHGLGWQITMTTIHKSSVHGLIISMNSSLLQIGGHWKEWKSVQKNHSQTGGDALVIPLGNFVLLCDHQKVVIWSKIITKANCLSWNKSTRTWMCISSNHLVVRFLCIWLIDGSYLTFISHKGMTCHLVQPLIPIYLLWWWRNLLKM